MYDQLTRKYCLCFHQHLTIANSYTTRNGVTCPTLISTLGCVGFMHVPTTVSCAEESVHLLSPLMHVYSNYSCRNCQFFLGGKFNGGYLIWGDRGGYEIYVLTVFPGDGFCDTLLSPLWRNLYIYGCWECALKCSHIPTFHEDKQHLGVNLNLGCEWQEVPVT